MLQERAKESILQRERLLLPSQKGSQGEELGIEEGQIFNRKCNRSVLLRDQRQGQRFGSVRGAQKGTASYRLVAGGLLDVTGMAHGDL